MIRRMLMGFAAVAALAFLGGGAFAADEDHGPCGLPTVKTMKERITLTDDQAKKVDEIYADNMKKSKEVEKSDADRKALKKEIVGKVKEVLTDEQDKKYDALIDASK